MPLRNSLAALAGLTLAAAVLVLVPANPGLAQEQEEALAYHAWFAANQTQDIPKAVEAAEAYLEKFPTGEYADFLTKWLPPARMSALDEALKAGEIEATLEIAPKVLADDPENLNVLYELARRLRLRELMASPRSYAHAAEAAEYSRRAIELVESGKILAGVQNFNKDATLAWLYQNLAIVAGKDGSSAKAIELYEKSTSLAPQDPAIAGRNFYRLYLWQQASYLNAANTYNALAQEDGGAAEPSPEVQAARAEVDAQADALIDVAAAFVAFAEVKKLRQATRDNVYGVLETVYKSRHPDDAEVAGLQAVIDSKKN